MKSLPLIGAALGVLWAAPGNSSVLTLGSTLARSCFEADERRAATSNSIRTCDLALTDSATTETDRVATHVNRGILFLIRHDYAVAARDFDAAIGMDPTQAEAWLNKAILKLSQGDGAGALSLATRAVALNTRRPELAYYVRGIANENSGQISAAYADLKKAQQLAPKWAEPTQELKRYRVRR